MAKLNSLKCFISLAFYLPSIKKIKLVGLYIHAFKFIFKVQNFDYEILAKFSMCERIILALSCSHCTRTRSAIKNKFIHTASTRSLHLTNFTFQQGKTCRKRNTKIHSSIWWWNTQYSWKIVNMFTAFPSIPIIFIQIVHGIRGYTQTQSWQNSH